ncbi:hypothetical protein BU26DRAFT_516188 [Trematosphaeria pertusa]|uniref:SUN domain-containing protein n=1 Tax=Trematosphaeria pertusa TaxID=390896 RepID=A0A6A6ITZ7_9PLEO|nr:uncharacterized protein BU26DRAFT_516188 [Trematosphaeria pertusa]KAF2253924.1 hypothetical protein BU26DRAFT_516188 [Trematosphaeria pertusa]
MPAIGAPLRKWTLLLLCSLPTCGVAQSTNEISLVEASASASKSSSPAIKLPSLTSTLPKSSAPSYADSACPFRTINYITHTLPQQCLKTAWSAPGIEPSAEGPADGEATAGPQVVIPWAREGILETGAEAEHEEAPAGAGSSAEDTGTPDAAMAGSTTSTQSEAEAEAETDSPLDNANFLSFEEWKKRNLARAGQSPENVGQGRAASSEQRSRRRPVNVNALDSLGEEGEIEIDFSGFGDPSQGDEGASNTPSAAQDTSEATTTPEEEGKAAPSSWALSKDAGKTCKERFNYASFDCAATVLKTNPQAKSSSAVLVENKDSYMLNECSAQNKFIIVELCDDILVDTLVLANYEFFSSMFRHFRVSVSDRYPVKMDRWRVLGTFEARNSRDIQPFLITEPQIWARYLRIEFLTQFGNEFYCPISLLRVHGTTMMEQFRREEEQARGDDDFVEPIEAAEGEPVQTAAPPAEDSGAIPAAELPVEPRKDATATSVASSQVEATTQTTDLTDSPSEGVGSGSQGASDQVPVKPPEVHPRNSTEPSGKTGTETEGPVPSPASASSAKSSRTETDTSRSSDPGASPATSSSDAASPPPNSPAEGKTTSSTTASSPSKDAKPSTNETTSATSNASSQKVATNFTSNGSQASSQSRSPTQPNAATPTTQESFFKSIHKRLQYLEANSTLSLQYIEEQSRILRDAFMKVEKKQLQKTEKFLDHLNSTVMQELKSYRNLYDQLWQSTILELEGMKERQKAEIGEIGARLSMVADELVWQKRMAVVQSTLLLLCLGLVLFVRSGTLGSQSDIPIVQQLGNTYSSFFESPPRSPENAGTLRRRRTFRNMWRSDTSAALSDRSGHLSDGINAASDAETDDRRSPVQVAFSPPTPVTPGSASDAGKESGSSPEQLDGGPGKDQDTGLPTPTDDNDLSLEEQARRIQVLETQSGPATPRGSRDSRPSWEEVDRAVGLLKAEENGQGTQLERKRDRERRKKRSPLRRVESYDGAASDSPGDDDGDELFVCG